jgi:hypothetical protein
MPYIGKNPVGGGFHKLDALTASATDTYALTLGSAAYYPESANQLLVSLNGVIQAPQDSFTVSGSNLVFDTALTASDSIDFVVALGDVLAVQTVTDGAITTNKIGTDAVTTAKIQDGAVTAAKLAGTYQNAVSVALIADQKTLNTAGGTFTSGAWRTRDLNTEIFDPDGIVSISSNQFTLGAGTYLIQIKAPVYRVGRNRVRLYNVTDSVLEGLSNSQFEDGDNDGNSLTEATVFVTPTASKTYEVQHIGENTVSTYGFGVESNLGGNEIYTTVFITKLA